MRKKLSKIIALLFILATTLGGAASVFAETEPIPTPGAKPTDGDLTIHKHWAETAADVGEEGTGGIMAPTPSNPAVKGIQFDVYQLTKIADAPDTPPSDKDDWTYSRNGTELTVKKDSTEHKYSLALRESDSGANGKTDADGVLKYSNLAAGYYYVEENLAESPNYEVQGDGNSEKTITSASKPFIVAVPMTNADGTDWNDDVHVYPKNQGLNPEKKPSVPSVNVGDKVEWTITVNVPSDIGSYTKFNIIDILDKRLNYAGNLVVEALDSSGNSLFILDKDDDYELNTPTDNTGGGTVTVELKADGITKLANNKSVVKLSVFFETTVNGNIDTDDENNINNEATIEFTNDSKTDTDQTPTATIHTGEIKIDKTYSGTEAITESAQFQLAASEQDAKAGNYLQVILDETDPQNIFIKKIVPAGTQGAVNWVALPSQADTGEALGLVGDTFYVTSFEGLKTYTETGSIKDFETYYLVETKAPEGYNLLDGPLEVTFTEDDNNNKHIHLKKIENKKGFTLPNTGGVGTILLVVVGIILIGLAIILTMNKKKKTA
ncbi:SpaH/EbpB family LPXTG-anchored major pilin [Enterococcus sp.]|uniref:SpaH/EbpB family LPXTG-anchored major pilin n=1 Tax=Enterococcus sp. TaxID=35783 RepID=UPI00290A6EF9|nr:SpaH/EbpB family LPXTG-anchored major pilin [Enterococcus sp.]MDU5333088.1 SpaH/EbpB family LPXTG-anchored major pilin [Enterococcus sp.]